MPANIQGLNIIQTQQSTSDPQDLVNGQTFPNLSAELDLWTNLTFDSEEGSLPHHLEEDKHQRKLLEEERVKSLDTAGSEKHTRDAHINVVTGTKLDDNLSTDPPQLPVQSHVTNHLPAFDIHSLLSGFGIDPFASLTQQPNSSTITPSLAHLLALHSHTPTFQHPAVPPYSHYPSPSPAVYGQIPRLVPTTQNLPLPLPALATSTTPAEEPATKRSRARKVSVSSPASPESPTVDTHVVALAAAEDKRRRNTAASARFRLKKKEREVALEGKAKELEIRVNELERECEGLRRENGWLKGLVVGVTGAAQAPVASAPPNLSASQLASLTNTNPGAKRGREDTDN